MTDYEIFQELFRIAESLNSKKGAVAACIFRDGKIILSSGSSDEPSRHAEDLLLEKARVENVIIEPNDILYVTLQPCGERTKGGGGEQFSDCATHIINSPVKQVVYGVPDHLYSLQVNTRFNEAGIAHRHFNNPEITEKARQIFNNTITDKEYIEQKGKRAFL